ncbi:MAG: hypothetical protein ABL940_10105, partial [Bacteroidia bacterium]
MKNFTPATPANLYNVLRSVVIQLPNQVLQHTTHNKNILKNTVAILFVLLSVKATQAQNIGVNTLNPDASAIMD